MMRTSHAMEPSTIQKKNAEINTNTSTMTVEVDVSLRVGQVILFTSWRTSRTNFAGLNMVYRI